MTRLLIMLVLTLWRWPAAAQVSLIFSPNGDGIKDDVVFKLNIQENTGVSRWELNIREQGVKEVEGALIKNFSGEGQPPKQVRWDGKDLSNRLVSDGTYLYMMSLVTPAGNQVAITPSPILVDRVPPQAQASVDHALFSPAGAKSEVTFTLAGSDANGVHGWILAIKDKDAVLVRSFRGKGEPSPAVRWDGRGDFEEDLPDGAYAFELMVEDKAGNRTATPPQKVSIKRREVVSTVDVNPFVFSPGETSSKKEVTLRIASGDPESVDHWELRVINQSGKIIHKFTGTKEPLSRIVWNGSLESKKFIEDGMYQVLLSETDLAGNTATTLPQPLEVDTSPPLLEARLEPALLSPNRDAFSDQGIFHLKVDDAHPLEEWSLKIFNDVGRVVKSVKGLRGSKPQAKWEWAGDGENGELLADGMYGYSLEAADIALNRAVTPKQPFRIDTTPPLLTAAAEPALFSPPLGPTQFNIQVRDAGPIESWSLVIADSGTKPVRTFTSSPENIPASVAWNGKNQDRMDLPDGEYTYVLRAKDVAGNVSATQPQKVTIGATAPAPEVVSDLRAISPNADGFRDFATFSLKAPHFNPIKEWALRISDKVKIQRIIQGRGDVPGKLQWNGENDDRRTLPNGDYFYELEVVDMAGNRSKTQSQPIRIDTTPPQLAAQATPNLFSPNGDKFKDESIFNLTYKDESPVGKWRLQIQSTEKKTVRLFSGEGNLPVSVSWDGKSQEAGASPDGSYTYIFFSQDEVGNPASTSEQIVKIDNTPPQVTLQADPKLFSPNIADAHTTFLLDYQDASDVSEWRLTVQKKDFTARAFSGIGRPPRSFPWDGKSEHKNPVPDGTYDAALHVTDEVGNRGQSKEAAISLDTSKPIISVTAETDSLSELDVPMAVKGDKDRDLVISLASEVLFDTGKAIVKPQAYSTLMRATYLIRRYPLRKIHVEGHADNVPIHNEEFKNNIELSQGRAEAIMNFFAEKGNVDRARMSAKGYGDTKPRASNDSDEGRRMNRRVEIILMKETSATQGAQK